ncbi:carbon-nitrogen hydrolase family protein [Sedimentitalea arenosa]|jgi:predicted amidohydrolase|uniref:Carbon-nitrogen hydrolase family protein n=1 Tax=Sedimentitalea arenosa TaxID=2798803 RepID=A0A8J7IQS4_9RHOB|nr:carbon-nitrogen hydrolase family protein [Arenibacterium arenosum]MBJ6371941.1 carbon-nitrogen hydrolase family protein [Arenibacterium arenosum]
MKAALLQLCSSDDPAENLATIRDHVASAATAGAELVLTPEVSNCVSTSRSHQAEVLVEESEDRTLAGLREQARDSGVWLLIGSLGLKTTDADGRFANRSFLIGPDGGIVARYDKIHMFDVQVTPEETYRESDGYRPGDRAVVAETPFGKIGMTICYDVRFAHLYHALAQAGARILTVPAAFSHVTGAAHWHTLLRARAIETGCFVLAPAQTGEHKAQRGKTRRTYGHSLAVSPWGEVLLDAGTNAGVHFVDLDLGAVDDARRKVPSLSHVRPFRSPGEGAG